MGFDQKPFITGQRKYFLLRADEYSPEQGSSHPGGIKDVFQPASLPGYYKNG